MNDDLLSFRPSPHADESFNGYLMRLAEENFLGSSTRLLQQVGIRFKARYSEAEVKTLGEAYGFDQSAVAALAAFKSVRGGLSNTRFLRSAQVPVCPHCLREQGYIRQAWHHVLMTACPVHRVLLLPRCPECEAPITPGRGGYQSCYCGCEFADVEVLPADAASLFVADLLHGHADARLTGFAGLPDDIESFLLFLANLDLVVPHRKNAPINWARALDINRAAYAFAEDLPGRFRAFVLDRVHAANALESSRFIANLGRWYFELNRTFAAEAYRPIREVAYRVLLEHAQAPINRKMKQMGADLLGLKSTYTAAEAARELGSSADRIVALVKSGQLQGVILQGGANEYCLVARAEVAAHKQAAAGFVSAKDLLKILGIGRRVRDRLLEIGLLTAIPAGQRPLFAKGDFRSAEAEALLAQLSFGAPHRHGDKLIMLDEISGKRFSNAQAGELLRKIFAGALKPIVRLPAVHGLKAYCFDEDAVMAAVKTGSGSVELTITELTKLTRWKHETIKSWIEQGFLPARRESCDKHRVFVALADLITFLSTYVVAGDTAERLGSKTLWLMKPLQTAGVFARGAHETSSGYQRGVLFSVDALVNVASMRASTWTRPTRIAARQPSGILDLRDVADGFCGEAESGENSADETAGDDFGVCA
ncbi:TniQ family protein [Pseudomonas agarici]|uniref:TniQ family protein n=2 Tax=Pseudomonas agarici TaxID=46677 RepID=UPI0002F5C7A7|nr:TniQ family protein [Pseudomonas agarici]NWC08817.1 TniQ family protein [Pseudomonas agarici]SEK58642.1 TniQ protein [Pseudomonas agarici]